MRSSLLFGVFVMSAVRGGWCDSRVEFGAGV